MQTLMYSKMLFKKVFFIATFLVAFTGVAQTFTQGLEDTLSDVLFLSNEFVSPAADASVYLTASSWATSANSLKKFKFDFSINGNVLPIPNNKKTTSIVNSDFKNLVIRGGENSAIIPTALGGDNATFFDFNIGGQEYEMQAFEGVDLSVIPYGYLQASVGLWKETELTVRYAPKLKIAESSYQTLGAALKHNLTQYTRDSENGLEVAILIAYSKFDLDLFFEDFKLQASNSISPPLAIINAIVVDGDMWMAQFIASKQIKKIELTGQVGLTQSKFDYSLGGDDGPILGVLNQQLGTLSENKLGLKADVGANYHFNKFYISSMLTLGNFTNLNLGVHYKI